MKPLFRTAVSAMFFLSVLRSGFAHPVPTHFNRQVNFSQYKPYSWQDVKPENSLWDARIKTAVDAQLAAKGWTLVASGGDVDVVAIKTTQTQKQLQTFYDGIGGGWRWRGFGGMWESSMTETG